MPEDTIVICSFCGRELPFGETYVTRNGSRPDTYECRELEGCMERARQRQILRSEDRAAMLEHGSVWI